MQNSLIYMPTADDIKTILGRSENKEFWEVIEQFDLREKQDTSKLRSNLFFNVEFAKITGEEINLSND